MLVVSDVRYVLYLHQTIAVVMVYQRPSNQTPAPPSVSHKEDECIIFSVKHTRVGGKRTDDAVGLRVFLDAASSTLPPIFRV